MILKVLGLCAGIVCCYAADAPVQMGETHLQRIQADLHALQKFVYKRFGGSEDYHDEGLTPPAQTETYESIQTLEAGIRDITQKLEKLEEGLHSIEALKARIDLLESQLQKMQKQTQTDHLKMASETEFVHFLKTELNLLSEPEKESVLKLFLKRFSENIQAAKYMKELAYMMYRQKRFKDTARYAGQFYKVAPDAPETPDMLLLLALSLHELSKPKEACLTLNKIETLTSNESPGFRERIFKARTKCGCPIASHGSTSVSKI